jgi:tripartite-type tricarboxylate transporter receptor subunit TctC
MMRILSMAVAFSFGLVATPNPSLAQSYPAKPIRFVVPFAAGSATDALARVLAQKLQAAQGWTVVIENLAGASGILAAQNVARAAPDGHTVFITSNTPTPPTRACSRSCPTTRSPISSRWASSATSRWRSRSTRRCRPTTRAS